MGLLTINELSGLGTPRSADPAAARRLMQQRAEDRAWLEMQRRTEGSPLQRIAAEAAHSLARLKRMDQEWLASQRRDSRSRVGRVSREAALSRARVARERAAAAEKLAAAKSGQHYGWATTKIEHRLMSPSEHASLAKRRFKGLFYQQPKAWSVTPEGKETPLPKVGAGWSREGVATAALESQGMDLAAERKFLKHYKDARREGKGSPTWRSFYSMYWRRGKDIARMDRAYDLRDQQKVRQRRERERQRMQDVLAARRAAYAKSKLKRPVGVPTYRGARAMAVPAPARTPVPTAAVTRRPVTGGGVIYGQQAAAPKPVVRGLVTAMGPTAHVARPSFLMMH